MEALCIISALQSFRYSYADEREFQNGISSALENSFISFERECDLGRHGIIDFTCGKIGIEAKIKGNRQDLLRQVARYTQHDSIDQIIIASARRSMIQGAPTSLNGKKIYTVFLGGFA